MQRVLTAKELENKAFDVFFHISNYCHNAEERRNYYDDIYSDVVNGKLIIEKTRLFIEAKRLVKRDANRTEAYSLEYPGNQEDVDTIAYVDKRRAELDNDPEVANLAALRHELTEFLKSKQTIAASITGVGLHKKIKL